MPMEPTSPMPSRSSGTKAMATPQLADLQRRIMPTSSCSGRASGGIGNGAAGHGLEAGDGLQQLLLAAAGNAGDAQNLAAVGGES